MVMTVARLRQLLEIHGTERSRWPAAIRPQADRLIETDPAAGRLFESARRLDAIIARSLEPAAGDDAIAARAMGALARRPLPPQRTRLLGRLLPEILLDLDFSPAWPRLAALAGIAALGFTLGLAGMDAGIIPVRDRAMVADGTAADQDLGVLIFEAEPTTGASLL